eukprot:scaffold17160_cov93-Cylindrotheca_fusiformis.AAC.1
MEMNSFIQNSHHCPTLPMMILSTAFPISVVTEKVVMEPNSISRITFQFDQRNNQGCGKDKFHGVENLLI